MFNIFVKQNENDELPQDDIFYIIGKNGIFLRKNLDLCDSLTKVDKISFLHDISSYAKMKIDKIPFSDFCDIVNFFCRVYDIYKTESIVHLYYNKDEKKYKIFCPKQEVTGAHVDYKDLPSSYSFGEGYSLLSSIHSHSSMGAFHSGGDTSDEKNSDGLHITIGNVNDIKKISISFSVVMNGARFILDPCDYIEDLELCEYIIEEQVPSYSYLSYTSNFTAFPKSEEKPKTRTITRYSIPSKCNEKIVMKWIKNVNGETYEERQKKHQESLKSFAYSNQGNFYDFYKHAFNGRYYNRDKLSLSSYGEDDSQGMLFDSPFGYVGFDTDRGNFMEHLNEIDPSVALPVECEKCIHKEEKLAVLFDTLDEYIEDRFLDTEEDDIMEIEDYNFYQNPENNEKLPKRVFKKDKRQIFEKIETFIWNSGLSKNEKDELDNMIKLIRKD